MRHSCGRSRSHFTATGGEVVVVASRGMAVGGLAVLEAVGVGVGVGVGAVVRVVGVVMVAVFAVAVAHQVAMVARHVDADSDTGQ